MEEPRIIAGYVIVRSFRIGGKEVAMGINEKNENPYMVCTFVHNPLVGVDLPEQAVASSDYLEMVQEFTDRIEAETLRLRDIRAMRESRGVNLNLVLSAAECIPGSRSADYAGQVLVIDPQRLAPEYRDNSNQIVYATHGNGCNPNGHGTSVFVHNVYTNETERWSRASILGVIQPERMPEWAKERLQVIRQEIAVQREKRRSEPVR